MPYFYKYQRASDSYTVYDLLLPDLPEDVAQCVELGTINGVTYILTPDGVELPRQPKQISLSVEQIIPDAKLLGLLKEASPSLRLTRARMEGKAAKVRYSKQDELTLKQVTSILPEAVTLDAKAVTLDAHVTEFRVWDKSAALEPIEVMR